jgi:hypothetical protein
MPADMFESLELVECTGISGSFALATPASGED